MRKMRRFKQELSKEAAVELLNKNTAGVLSLNGDDGYPYGVPLSYAYHNDKIYFHSAKAGYKVDCMANNPKASFTVIDTDQIVEEEYTTYFRSVIAFGDVRVVEGDEKREGFMALVDKYSPSIPKEMREKEVNGCNAALIYAIDINVLSGKQAIEFVGK